MHFRYLLLTSLLLLLVACGGVPKEMKSLDTTLRAYENTVRWSRLEQSAQFMRNAPEFTSAEIDRFRNIKVTGYRAITTSVSNTHARQTVEIRYFNSEYAIERTLSDMQEWEYDAEAQRWYLLSSFPEFK